MSKLSENSARQLRKLDFDLANYFSNTIIPQLFVDADLVLRIFTPPAMKQFSLSYRDVGRNIHDVKDNICYPTIADNIQEVIDTNKILEKEIQTTDGSWYQMNIVPYIEHEENRTNGVIITFVDITKRLKTLRELEKLNADHKVLMFALAHDIRQPISTITLLTQALEIAYNNNDQEKFNHLITSLKRSSKNIESLVNDFTVNHGASNENTVGERINIQEIVTDVLLALREEINAEKIRVITEFNFSEIIFPKNNLRSIVYNLIHNSIKFRNSEGEPQIKIRTEKVRDFVIFEVKDNGIGIAVEDQRKIFHKYSRINENIQGTGMGLYIIKKMIQNKEGRLELESKPGEGSTFKVYFKSEYSFKNVN